ncbi:MAG TPA: hypothetical protein VMU05_02810 [Dongiaceae bacterium]|nr:hypothetical protein [Dongiaceae bacterium]
MSLSLPLQSSDNVQRVELEDGWELLIDPSGRMPYENAQKATGWRSARVGLSWNVQFEDLREYMGAAWYRLRFELAEFQDTRHVLLKFGAVDYFCEVFVNGISIGTHEGGYTPFSFEVTSAVHPGMNEMMIRVVDPPMDEAQNRALFPEMMYNEIPHGKQNWYVQNSGIWQGVRLELCPGIYIERLDVTPRVSGEFDVETRLSGVGLTAEGGALASNVELRVRAFEKSGRCVFDQRMPLDPSSHNIKIHGTIARPRLWSPDDPELYVLTAELTGAVKYRRRTRFGFRSFESKAGKLYFNGEPFFIRAALDQDFYPETIHTPTSMEFVRDMMLKAKKLGINMLRCHLKVAHPVYLDVADEVGMLIWTELPSWSDSWFPSDHFSTMAAVRADRMFWEILIRDWNHPCIVLQTIMNESWGINLKDASQREWLRTTFDRIKDLLKPLGRLVVDNSPCEGNFHVKSDLEDFHQYYSIPDHVRLWDQWVAELASRPRWTFSPYGDAVRTGEEPLLVSEFGNWGLPQLPEQLPWWFDISFGERGVTKPAGVLERFHAYGLDKIFGTFNELAEETQRHQFISLKHEIESIRSYESLQGYVITGITDVHWEVNGLLDMWRNEKVYVDDLRSIQNADLVACKLPACSFYESDTIEIPTFISHFSRTDLSGAVLRWNTSWGQSGRVIIAGPVPPGSVRELPAIQLTLPCEDAAVPHRLELELRQRNGARFAENCYTLPVLPRRAPTEIKIAVAPDCGSLAPALAEAGLRMESDPTPDVLMIAGEYDAAVEAHLQNRGRVLLLAGSETSLPGDAPLKIALRSGTELDGRWFSNFNWIRRDRAPFSSVGLTPILGFESAAVAPAYIIQGLTPDQFDDVLSGITYGWLNNNCALAAQMKVGPGQLLITTYRFHAYGTDPYATELLNAFVEYSVSSEMRPNLTVAMSAALGPAAIHI